ncbi:MAG: hypothetical protein GY765_39500 [bacterium]|nr:hypothetical protein [bacterium]
MEERPTLGGNGHLFVVNLLEKLIVWCKGLMTANLLNFCIKWLSIIGHYAIFAAAGLGTLFSLIYAIKENDFRGFLMGVAGVLLLFVIQYTAHKFSSAGEKQIANNPSHMSSKIFLDCVGFLALIGGVALFIFSFVELIKGMPFIFFLKGVGVCVFMEFVALVAFNFKVVAVGIVEDNSAGQEAIGILSFFIKTVVKLIPILFGALLVLGTVMLVVEGVKLFGKDAKVAWDIIYDDVGPQILGAALLPFVGYLFFVLAYLVIDIIRAILSLLDKRV